MPDAPSDEYEALMLLKAGKLHIIPLRGLQSEPDSRYGRTSFTRAELDAMAPELTRAEWLSLAENCPSRETREKMSIRIEAAHTLKYRRPKP